MYVNGASDDRHFVEIMGSGGLFFDFDGDGSTDLFLVDGGSLVDRRTGRGIVCIAIAATAGSRT